MSKIVIKVVTELRFNNEEDFSKYLETDSLARVTGFREEIKQAWKNQAPLHVETNRPQYGAVTVSTVEAYEVFE